MTKPARQRAILETVERQPLASQEELRRVLMRRGFEVTQATLSRDIHELGLVKTVHGYALPNDAPSPDAGRPTPERMIREFVHGSRQAQNLLVLKTNPGSAQPVAVAIDRQNWPEVVGTVAGDDTILCVCTDKRAAGRLAQRIREVLE